MCIQYEYPAQNITVIIVKALVKLSVFRLMFYWFVLSADITVLIDFQVFLYAHMQLATLKCL